MAQEQVLRKSSDQAAEAGPSVLTADNDNLEPIEDAEVRAAGQFFVAQHRRGRPVDIKVLDRPGDALAATAKKLTELGASYNMAEQMLARLRAYIIERGEEFAQGGAPVEIILATGDEKPETRFANARSVAFVINERQSVFAGVTTQNVRATLTGTATSSNEADINAMFAHVRGTSFWGVLVEPGRDQLKGLLNSLDAGIAAVLEATGGALDVTALHEMLEQLQAEGILTPQAEALILNLMTLQEALGPQGQIMDAPAAETAMAEIAQLLGDLGDGFIPPSLAQAALKILSDLPASAPVQALLADHGVAPIVDAHRELAGEAIDANGQQESLPASPEDALAQMIERMKEIIAQEGAESPAVKELTAIVDAAEAQIEAGQVPPADILATLVTDMQSVDVAVLSAVNPGLAEHINALIETAEGAALSADTMETAGMTSEEALATITERMTEIIAQEGADSPVAQELATVIEAIEAQMAAGEVPATDILAQVTRELQGMNAAALGAVNPETAQAILSMIDAAEAASQSVSTMDASPIEQIHEASPEDALAQTIEKINELIAQEGVDSPAAQELAAVIETIAARLEAGDASPAELLAFMQADLREIDIAALSAANPEIMQAINILVDATGETPPALETADGSAAPAEPAAIEVAPDFQASEPGHEVSMPGDDPVAAYIDESEPGGPMPVDRPKGSETGDAAAAPEEDAPHGPAEPPTITASEPPVKEGEPAPMPVPDTMPETGVGPEKDVGETDEPDVLPVTDEVPPAPPSQPPAPPTPPPSQPPEPDAKKPEPEPEPERPAPNKPPAPSDGPEQTAPPKDAQPENNPPPAEPPKLDGEQKQAPQNLSKPKGPCGPDCSCDYNAASGASDKKTFDIEKRKEAGPPTTTVAEIEKQFTPEDIKKHGMEDLRYRVDVVVDNYSSQFIEEKGGLRNVIEGIRNDERQQDSFYDDDLIKVTSHDEKQAIINAYEAYFDETPAFPPHSSPESLTEEFGHVCGPNCDHDHGPHDPTGDAEPQESRLATAEDDLFGDSEMDEEPQDDNLFGDPDIKKILPSQPKSLGLA